jgi:DNA-binding transcriptional regulator YiaG
MTACLEYRGPLNAHGYARVPFGEVRTDEKGRKRGRKMVMLHVWIVEQIEGRPLGLGERVMHECDNPPCFRYEHLRRATQADNIADMMAKGRHRTPHGEESPNVKLTDDAVKLVRARGAEGFSQRAIAAEFGVSRALVRKILRGEHRA